MDKGDERPQEVISKWSNRKSGFNIKGNDYRLVMAIDYRRDIVFIKWIGAHKHYDEIDVRTVQYGDQAHQD